MARSELSSVQMKIFQLQFRELVETVNSKQYNKTIPYKKQNLGGIKMANGSLAVGTVIKTKYGGSIKVEKYLAEGGQGEVYVVACNGGKEKKALKWYKTAALGKDPRAFYENIEENIKRGSPDKAFLWPEDITEWTDGTFGYVMGLRPVSLN